MNPLLTDTLSAVLSAVVPIALGWGLMILQKKTGISLTDQQRATVIGAVNTSAGVLVTMLAKKTLTLDSLHSGDTNVRLQANRVMAAVPDAVAGLGVSHDTISTMIVGRVGNLIATDPSLKGTLP